MVYDTKTCIRAGECRRKRAASASRGVKQMRPVVGYCRLGRMVKRLLYGFAVDADDFPYPEFGQTDILVTVRLCNGNLHHTAFNAAAV